MYEVGIISQMSLNMNQAYGVLQVLPDLLVYMYIYIYS